MGRADDTRIGELLSAVMAVGSDLELPQVLRRIVDSARSLAGARYAALGVLREDGRGLADFIFSGIDEAVANAIGHLPEGHGILGLLITDPQPLRLGDLSDHPRSYGFPPHHPPMRSFLGVPVRVGDEVYGNLYLTEKQGAPEFTEEDEELVVTLAAAAGAAVRNARLFQETSRRERWLEATREISAALLAGEDFDRVLELVPRRARELVGADLSTIAVPHGAQDLVLTAVDGVEADRLRGMTFPRGESISGEVIRQGTTVVQEDAASDPHAHQPVVRVGGIGPAMLIPLVLRGEAFGTLLVARLRGREPFTDEEVRMVEALAGQASLVLEFGRVQRELRRLAVVEDRERIARDLHDTVIQQLFATGLGLQALAQRCKEDHPEIHERLLETVADLDRTIDQIRGTIFSLQAPGGPGLRARLLGLAEEAAETLGFAPEVRFRGPVDTRVPPEAGRHLVATFREALSNVARHARASRVEVTVEAGDELVLRVADDGAGLTGERSASGRGLRNMAERAYSLGGDLEIGSQPGEGTTLVWRVPLGG